jgi:predicted lipoprotein
VFLNIIKNDPQFDSQRNQIDFQAFMKRLEAEAEAKS